MLMLAVVIALIVNKRWIRQAPEASSMSQPDLSQRYETSATRDFPPHNWSKANARLQLIMTGRTKFLHRCIILFGRGGLS